MVGDAMAEVDPAGLGDSGQQGKSLSAQPSWGQAPVRDLPVWKTSKSFQLLGNAAQDLVGKRAFWGPSHKPPFHIKGEGL